MSKKKPILEINIKLTHEQRVEMILKLAKKNIAKGTAK